jgi:FPC/CPF motif-containing protein YcgG
MHRSELHYDDSQHDSIVNAYKRFLLQSSFPCVAAKAAMARQQISCMIAVDMGSEAEDPAILDFLYEFIEKYRNSKQLYQSAAVIFVEPIIRDEEHFEKLFWKRLQCLADLDASHYWYDDRVSMDVESAEFSFSLKGEAHFVLGLHPYNSRPARRFSYPTIVFNPHEQFEMLREKNSYESLKRVIRHRDQRFFGSINPMLDDFGSSPEVLQYSGRKYDHTWQCPLKIKHAKI